jgi:anhydro-N-acetylmuramic acid kinase
MTGTSLDGLDVALVEIRGVGLDMRPRFIRAASTPLGAVGDGLRELAEQRAASAGRIAELMREFALLHARAIAECLAGESCDLVCVHGQTVYHKPPVSWQLMQPAPIVHAIGAPVVYDLRQADLAAGGQGAPITPIADHVLFRDVPGTVCVVNLGGYCNFTRLNGRGPQDIEARDVCACNQLLDRVARVALGRPFDENGSAAQRGRVDPRAEADLCSLLAAQGREQRSLGTGDELSDWVERYRADVSPEDLCATACAGIARVIVQACRADRLILAGGGTRNIALCGAIEDAQRRTEYTASGNRRSVSISDDWGVPALYREAACFAVLGALCRDAIPITLPRVTGCRHPAPLSGAWMFPGAAHGRAGMQSAG